MKPLGRKAYGSIGHLPNSKLGPGDYHVHEGQARICTERTRDKHDTVIVQEKLDGSCCAVAMIDGKLVAMTRKGYEARTSPFAQHHLFADWVDQNAERFHKVLREGERLVGEWLAQAHGTLYPFMLDPWRLFDLMTGTVRLTYDELLTRNADEFFLPALIAIGKPIDTETAFARIDSRLLQYMPEGLVYRVERNGKVDFLAKWVRPDFIPGKYFPENNDGKITWNWLPKDAAFETPDKVVL